MFEKFGTRYLLEDLLSEIVLSDTTSELGNRAVLHIDIWLLDAVN